MESSMGSEPSAIISLESDEEMENNVESEAPTTTPNPEEETTKEESPTTENVSDAPKSPDNSTVDQTEKDSDIICIDDDAKEPSPSVEKEPEAEPPAETVTAAEPQTVAESNDTTTPPQPEPESVLANEDVEMKEIDPKEQSEQNNDEQRTEQPESQQPPEESQTVDGEMDTGEKSANAETAKEDPPMPDQQQEPVVTNGNAGEQEQTGASKKRRPPKCCNTACKKRSGKFCEAPEFALSLYKVRHSVQMLYVCMDCFDEAVERYEMLSTLLINHQPLLLYDTPRDESEILMVLDSSDEEDEDAVLEKKNEPILSPETIALVESELSDVLCSMYGELCIDQVKWSNTILMHEAMENEKTSDAIEATIKTLKAGLQDIHNNIYSIRTQKIDSAELIIEDDVSSERIAQERFLSIINRNEILRRDPVIVGKRYYGVRTTVLASWSECVVMEEKSNQMYALRFLRGDQKPTIVTAKQLAYPTRPNVKLRLGTRVIARSSDPVCRSFYAGTVMESMSSYNNYRYLIIFDSGQTLYSHHDDVRVVCDQSKHVWDDVHPHSREFIRNYMLKSGSVRPMVQAHRGQRLIVEIDQKWYQGQVIETDSSLVRLYFPVLERKEWIYRGSRRLAPLFREVSTSNGSSNKLSKFQKRNEPAIEYITLDDDDEEGGQTGKGAEKRAKLASSEQQPHAAKADVPRATARKSTTNRSSQPNSTQSSNSNNNNVPVSLNRNTIYIDCESHGRTLFFTTRNYRGPRKFAPHTCNPNCLYRGSKNLRSYNLLARPLITGWERQVARGSRKHIFYRAPCGRRIRDMAELHHYLRVTDATLNVEHFDFDPEIRALATFKVENVFFECTDLSFGAEPMPVHCVNNYDNKQPPPCEYSTERIPTEGVNLNLDKEFLCGCDCEDDCVDKSKCQCWQLTLAGARYSKQKNLKSVGYQYKRLMNPVLTGIYECNAQCKCKKDKCLNRVVQNSLQTKLQVFNTHNKGWGIRCLNDVPKGSFICIYAGHLLTEETSNRICAMSADKSGDEYFADLDYIETVEKHKADYEAEAYQSDREDEPPAHEEEASDGSEEEGASETFDGGQDSDEEYTTKSKPSGTVVKTRAQLRKASMTERPNAAPQSSTTATTTTTAANAKKASNVGVNDEQERVTLIPNPEMDMLDASGANDESAFRKMYGENEHIFVMDAKKSGNLGRYFNHSCAPNLFVQNVFVDTHDLRFPWVAFFAEHNIVAGTELTWNYNYDVGTVSGKHLTCNCGEKACRGRLL